MTWVRDISAFEIFLIAGFVFLYGLYVFSTYQKSKQLARGGIVRTLPKFLLRSFYFALLIIAVLGPSFGKKELEIKSISKDIYLAIDLSMSMNANDVQPTRLEKLKFELKRLVHDFKGERIGLIIFSSEAFIQCPITYDQKALNMFIETLNSNLVPNAGTDLAAPLLLALEKHKSEQEGGKPSSKVIVLMSDGEDFSGEAQEAAEEIKKAGIKLFTVGIGSASGSKIPYGSGYKRDNEGNVVISKLNPDGLKKLAFTTEGSYYEIGSSRNQINQMIKDISRIKGETRETRKIDVSSNKYSYFLIVALVLITLDVLFTLNVLKIE